MKSNNIKCEFFKSGKVIAVEERQNKKLFIMKFEVMPPKKSKKST